MPMHMMDDRWYSKVSFDELEVAGDHTRSWDAHAWLGKDLQGLWLKTEGRRSGGATEHAEVQALYSRAVAPYWDLQTGYRHDFQPNGADWAVLGVRGLAPYFFDVEASLFLGENARTALRLKASHQLLLTQRLILTPEAQLDAFGGDDPLLRNGSGISDLELGLRLRYEIRREIAPYVGVRLRKKLGGAKDFARAFGEQTSDTQWVAGLRFWF
jgi:copper resistance protein B